MANRFWVGGNANWDATAGTKWATTSGGAGGAAVPTAADDVFLDNGTGTGNVTIPSATTVVCRSLNCTGYIKVLAFASTTAVISIGDATAGASNIALKLVSGMTLTLTGIGTINFLSTSTTQQTVDSGTLTLPNVTFNGSGGTWKLNNTTTLGTGTTLTLTAGAVDINGKAVSIGLFSSSNSNTRSMQDAAGGGSIAVTGNNATVWTTVTATNLTLNSNLPTINFSYTGSTGTRTISGSVTGQSSSNVVSCSFGAATDIVSIAQGWKVVNFSGLGAATVSNNGMQFYGNLTIGTSPTYTAGTNTWTFSATSGTITITSNGKTLDFPLQINGNGATYQLADNLTMGTSRTFTLLTGALDFNGKTLSCGLFDSSSGSVRTLTLGTGVLQVTGNAGTIINFNNVSNLTVTFSTGYIDCNYSGSTGTRTLSFNGLGSSKAFNVKISAGTDTIAQVTGFDVKNLDFTGFAGTLTDSITKNIYGNLTIASGMTLSSGSTGWIMKATSGTPTITSNGKTISAPFEINGAGGTFQIQDNFTVSASNTFFFTAGTIDLNGHILSVGNFNSNVTNTRAITVAAGSITVTGNNGTIWNMPSNQNFTLSAALTVTCNYSGSTGTRTIAHANSSAFIANGIPTFAFSAGTDIVVLDNSYVGFDFTGFTGTLSTDGNIYIINDAKFSSGMTLSAAGPTLLDFPSTNTSKLTTAGQTLPWHIELENQGPTVQFQDDVNIGELNVLVYKGTLTTNNHNLTCGTFQFGGDAGIVINMGSSTVTCSSGWQLAGAIGTFNCGTSIIILNGGSNQTQFTGGALTYYEVRMLDWTVFNTFSSSTEINTYTNLKIIKSTFTRALSYMRGNHTVTGTLTMTEVDLIGNGGSTQNVLTAAVVSLAKANFWDISAAGAAAPFTGTNLGDMGSNSNITFTTGVNKYWVGNGGNWSDTAHWSLSSGGAGGAAYPLPQDTAKFNANSFSSGGQTIVTNLLYIGHIDFTGVTNNPAFSIATLSSNIGYPQFLGNITFVPGMTISDPDNHGIQFGNYYNCNFDSGGQTLYAVGIFGGYGLGATSTITLLSNLITSSWFEFTPGPGGCFDANDFNVTCDNLATYPSDPTNHFYMGNGTWTVTGDDTGYEGQPIYFEAPAYWTLHAEGSTIVLTSTSGNNKTISFNGGSGNANALNNLTLRVSGAGQVIFADGGNTFNVLKVDAALAAVTVSFLNSTTNTARQFAFQGYLGKVITLISDVGASAFTLSQAGGMIPGNYLSLQDCVATGGATFYAANSTDVSGNSGWKFKPAPSFMMSS